MPTYTCSNCGIPSPRLSTDRIQKIKLAANSNKSGPVCDLCLHLEMARRYASHQGLSYTASVCRDLLDNLNLSTKNSYTVPRDPTDPSNS